MNKMVMVLLVSSLFVSGCGGDDKKANTDPTACLNECYADTTCREVCDDDLTQATQVCTTNNTVCETGCDSQETTCVAAGRIACGFQAERCKGCCGGQWNCGEFGALAETRNRCYGQCNYELLSCYRVCEPTRPEPVADAAGTAEEYEEPAYCREDMTFVPGEDGGEGEGPSGELYTVVLTGATIAAQNASGGDWDFDGNAPDPQATLSVDSVDVDKTHIEDNTFYPVWGSRFVVRLFADSLIGVVVMDDDSGVFGTAPETIGIVICTARRILAGESTADACLSSGEFSGILSLDLTIEL